MTLHTDSCLIHPVIHQHLNRIRSRQAFLINRMVDNPLIMLAKCAHADGRKGMFCGRHIISAAFFFIFQDYHHALPILKPSMEDEAVAFLRRFLPDRHLLPVNLIADAFGIPLTFRLEEILLYQFGWPAFRISQDPVDVPDLKVQVDNRILISAGQA